MKSETKPAKLAKLKPIRLKLAKAEKAKNKEVGRQI